MTWLRAQVRQGILGQDRATIAVSLVLLLLVNVARVPYDLLNHGPAVLNLNTIAGGLALAFSTSLVFRRLVLDRPVTLFRSPARPG